MKNANKVLCVFITFTIIFINTIPINADTTIKEAKDPFSYMYDSDLLVQQELAKRSDIIKIETEHRVNIKDIKTDNNDYENYYRFVYQEVKNDEEIILNNIYKNERFIIKYKNNDHKSFKDIISNTEIKIDEINNVISSDRIELIKLSRKINPSELANILKHKGIENIIEYIQPDYILSTDGFNIDIIESDFEDKNTALPIKDEFISPTGNDNEYQIEENKTIENHYLPHDNSIDNINEDELMFNNNENKIPVKVAVIDTGVDINHDLLKTYMLDGWNFISNDNMLFNPEYPLDSSHGTHICGIITKIANDSNINIEVLPLKVFENGIAYTSDILSAISYAKEYNASIINCSFGSSFENPILYETMNNTNALFVCAVGNNRNDLDKYPSYPASYRLSNILSVASVNADGGFSYFSNYSSNLVDITAIGRDVWSTLPNNGNGQMTGTSMSAAYISGVATIASAKSTDKNNNPEEIREKLLYYADKLPNLYHKVIDGKKVNLINIINDSVGTEIIIYPENDYDVHGYNPNVNELFELFSSNSKIKASAEFDHSIILDGKGDIWAWGYNRYGQLGDGTTVDKKTPVQVMISNVIDISAGSEYNLAIKSNGTVWAWGFNIFGQLGDGSTTNRSIPVQVNGLTDIISISAGIYHSLALKNDGTVWAWGSNNQGAIGDSTWVSRTSPVKVSNLSNIIAISAGGNTSFALKSDGTVWAWGYNRTGDLGIGSYSDRNIPTNIDSINNIISISAGRYSTYAIKSNGTLYAWGSNGYGQLGDNTLLNRIIPVQAVGINNVKEVYAGIYHCIAYKIDNTVWSWGRNDCGQLGNGTYIDNKNPNLINNFTGINAIASKGNHNIVIKSNNTVWTWGENNFGQLGDGTVINKNVPCQLGMQVASSLIRYNNISTGASHNLKINTNDTIWVWGKNSFGQLGDNSVNHKTLPEKISIPNMISVSTGDNHSLALKRDGTAYAWGKNEFGQLGDGTKIDKKIPIQISSLSGIVYIAAGLDHSIALKNDGTVWAWGSNSLGELGQGTWVDSHTPLKVSNLTDVVSVSVGGRHNFAIKSDGTVWAWGYNYNGQLGDGTSTSRTSPVKINGLTDVKYIISGGYHSFAIKNDGSVWAWGNNYYGQLGDGTLVNKNIPTCLSGFNNVKYISAGNMHSLAVKTDGTVWSWGFNFAGQLGDNSYIDKKSPVKINNFYDVDDIYAGNVHSLAIKNDGTVWAWGYNNEGQLGNGTTSKKNYPDKINFNPNTSIGFNTVLAQPLTFTINGNKIKSFKDEGSRIPFTLTYDETYLLLNDFATQTSLKDISAGPVLGTPINILYHTNGAIVFTIDLNIPTGGEWSGIVTFMKFTALNTGMTSITIT